VSDREEQGREDYRDREPQAEKPLDRCSDYVDDRKCRTSEQDLLDDGSDAANEVCPFWPGQPMTAHWGIPDPAAVTGTPDEIDRAFSQAFQALDRRISLFLCLPFATIDTFAL
jgi:hypothetical protein